MQLNQLGRFPMEDTFHASDVAEFRSCSGMGSVSKIPWHEEIVARGDRTSVSRHATTPRSPLSKDTTAKTMLLPLPCLSGLAPRPAHFQAGRCLHLELPHMFQGCILGHPAMQSNFVCDFM